MSPATATFRDPTAIRVRASLSPLSGLVPTLVDLLRDRPGRLPSGVGVGFRAGSAPAALITPAISGPARPRIPDCLYLGEDDGTDFGRALDRMRTVASSELPGEVLADWHGSPPREWRPAVHQPARWVTAWTSLLAELWDHSYEQAWRRARGPAERELDRVARAAVSGGLPPLLAGLHPHLAWRGGTMTVATSWEVHLEDPVLHLVPMASGQQVMMHSLASGLARVAYPLPGLDALLRRGYAVPASDPLVALVGPRRQAALRTLVRRPMSGTELAESMGCPPSGVTYHLGQLVDADLVRRERRGKQVVHALTDRGMALLDAYPSR